MAETKAPEENIQRLRATGRNDTCPCGSGKKYKKCHLRDDEEQERLYLAALEQAQVEQAAAGHDPECEDPDCKEDHAKSEGKKARPQAKTPAGTKPVPKGPAGAATANAQRSMPRKAQ